MNQSASLYAFNSASFAALPTAGPLSQQDLHAAANWLGFDQQAFDYLEQLLQHLRPHAQTLLREIFNPSASVQSSSVANATPPAAAQPNAAEPRVYAPYLHDAAGYLLPDQVEAISQTLQTVSPTELGICRVPSSPEATRTFNQDYVADDFERLQHFFAASAASELYVVHLAT